MKATSDVVFSIEIVSFPVGDDHPHRWAGRCGASSVAASAQRVRRVGLPSSTEMIPARTISDM
jgi:hypothetical protein